MKNSILIIIAAVIFLNFISCTDPDALPTPPDKDAGIIYGQVFDLSHPGPIPVGWEPPAYENICTVIAQDTDQNISIESRTSAKGFFSITAPAGKYYLRVKASPISSVTGPYFLSPGVMIQAKAYYDSGMR